MYKFRSLYLKIKRLFRLSQSKKRNKKKNNKQTPIHTLELNNAEHKLTE